jgi:single-stranded-DNA-specific exonuclease
LIRHGGHAAAAGFTIDTPKLEALRERLQAIAAETLSGKELQPALEIDRELPLEEVSWATLDLLRMLEPTGMDNPQPVLASLDVEVREKRALGDGQHLKLTLRDGHGAARDAIWFRQGHLLDQVPGRVDVAYTLEANEWNHQKRLQLYVQDLRPAQRSTPGG